MRNFLSFLNDKDRNTLIGKAKRHTYHDGERILTQGDKNTTLYFIHAGDVSIVSRIADQEMEMAQLHRNDVFGEMSYVDREPVSADIIALGDATIDYVKASALKAIVQADPLFYGRFYRAISQTLSHRLRLDNHKAQSYMSQSY